MGETVKPFRLVITKDEKGAIAERSCVDRETISLLELAMSDNKANPKANHNLFLAIESLLF